MIRILVLFVMLSMGGLSCRAYSFEAAEKAYNTGDYKEAVALYTEGMEKEGISAGLLYNLGNSYYRLGDDGNAILCYERAYKLDPGNKMIKQNLEFLTMRVRDANKGSLQGKTGNLEPDNETITDSIYRLIAVETQSNSWAVMAVMAFILFLGGLAMYMFVPNILARKTGFFSGLIFLGFTALFVIFAFLAKAKYERQDEAILMSFTTELLRDPQEKAPTTTTPLHKGTKIKILESKKGADGNEWLKVKLNADNSGWVKKENVEII